MRDDPRASYSLAARRASISENQRGKEVHVDTLEFSTVVGCVTPDGGSGTSTADLKGDFDIREGQRVIIGKSGIGQEGTALIVVQWRKGRGGRRARRA